MGFIIKAEYNLYKEMRRNHGVFLTVLSKKPIGIGGKFTGTD